jgi:hypothetical protein
MEKHCKLYTYIYNLNMVDKLIDDLINNRITSLDLSRNNINLNNLLKLCDK